jgi:hypothetical protein
MHHNSRASISLRVKQKLLVLASIGIAGCMQPMRSMLGHVVAESELARLGWRSLIVVPCDQPGHRSGVNANPSSDMREVERKVGCDQNRFRQVYEAQEALDD